MVGYAYQSKEKLATHVLVFYASSISGAFRMAIGHFGTTSACGLEVATLLEEGIILLERVCALKVE